MEFVPFDVGIEILCVIQVNTLHQRLSMLNIENAEGSRYHTNKPGTPP
jgi:hypothetical protein